MVGKPVVGTNEESLAQVMATVPGRKTVLFLGSSLGNYTTEEAVDFLAGIHGQLRPRDRLVIGVDLPAGPRKPKSIIESAYDDEGGVTAEFTTNSLNVINNVAGYVQDRTG